MILDRPNHRLVCWTTLSIALGAMCLTPARADESLFAQHSSQSPTAAQPVQQAGHVEPSRLSSSGGEASLPLPGAPRGDIQKSSGSHTFEAVFSVFASLAAVLGLFFGIAWIMRRGLPSATSARLPAEAVDVLGRAPLAGRQQLQLLRLGNKLLLVCISAAGVSTLGEISDPEEVERVAALCRSGKNNNPGALAKNLRQTFGAPGGDQRLARAASVGEAADA